MVLVSLLLDAELTTLGGARGVGSAPNAPGAVMMRSGRSGACVPSMGAQVYDWWLL